LKVDAVPSLKKGLDKLRQANKESSFSSAEQTAVVRSAVEKLDHARVNTKLKSCFLQHEC